MNNLRHSILYGIVWQYSQRVLVQGVHFLVSLILARLLEPKDFGVIALIGVFITIANLFIDSGFGNALIQKKEVNQLDYSSIFYTNVGVSLLLYFCLFLSAPFVASFYEIPIVKIVLRVQAIILILMSLSCVQNAILVKKMDFKKNFIINLIAVFVSSIVGIVMAYNHMGIWSLVFSQLSLNIITTILLWYIVRWRPSMAFSLARVKLMFGYSSRILLGSITNVLYNNIFNIIIGKQYTIELLGFYNRGALIPTIVVDNAANTLNQVLFPALSKIQDDRETIRRIVKRMLSIVMYLVLFLMSILFIYARPLTILFFSEKWLPMIPFMRIVCITVLFYPMILINTSMLTAIGRSDLYFKSTLLGKVISIFIVLVSIKFGVYYMVASAILGTIISTSIISYWSNKFIHYSLKEQFTDIMPILMVTIISAIVSSLLFLFNFSNNLVLLFIGLIFYTAIYILFSYILKVEPYIYISTYLKEKIVYKL